GDPARCKASYEAAQVAIQGEHFEAARAQLATCQRLCPAPLVKDCTRWLEGVDATAPSVRLGARDADGKPISDVLITLDGVLVEHKDRAVPVEPGAHVFRFERPGYTPAEARVEIHGGERDRSVVVVLVSEKRGPEAPTPRGGSTVPSFVVGAIGGVALLAAGFLAIDGHVERSNLRSTCAPTC